MKHFAKPGMPYKKAGVMLLELERPEQLQADMFGEPTAGNHELMAALDAINRRYGRGTPRPYSLSPIPPLALLPPHEPPRPARWNGGAELSLAASGLFREVCRSPAVRSPRSGPRR